MAMSKVLNVSRSGYYDWLKREPSKRSEEEAELLIAMRDIHVESRFRAGSPKLYRGLRKKGYKVNHKRVERIARKYGLKAIFRKSFRKKTTDSNHRYPVSANLLKRNFTASRPNQVWVSDITYLRTNRGWLYLCVVIDLFSRKVVGWSMSKRIDTAIVADAFKMAVQARRPQPWQLVFHSDRGSQYASYAFRRLLKDHKVISSMSGVADCYDNACAESWFSLLKRELIYMMDEQDFDQIRTAVFEYIEVYYNRQRMHSTIDYMTPEEFELHVA